MLLCCVSSPNIATIHSQRTSFALLIYSYGSRGEIVNACRSVSAQVQAGSMGVEDITEQTFSAALSTANCPGKAMTYSFSLCRCSQ